MSNEPSPVRTSGVPLTLALIALAIAVFLAAQITSAGQQARLITFQMENGEKQIATAKENEVQLKKLIEQQDVVVAQAKQVQEQYQKMFEDLLKLAEDDQDAKAIVEKWKIQRAAKDAKEGAAAEKPAEKKP